MPNMPKLYGKPYHRDEPLLDDSKENEDDLQPQRKLSAIINARRFASNVKSNVSMKTQNLTPKIHLLPTTRQYGFSATESRDDELQEMEDRHLLTAYSDERVFRINATCEEERDMPQGPLSLEAVDFGGFDVEVEIEEKNTTSEREEGSVDSREYTKLYANITRGISDDDSSDRESGFSIVTECEASAETARKECDIESELKKDLDDRSVGSVRSAKELNDAFQLNVPDEDSIVESDVIEQISETEELNIDEHLIRKQAHTSLPSLYYMHGPNESVKEMSLSSNASVVSSSATSSILAGVDIPDELGCEEERIEVFTPSRSNSDDGVDCSNAASNVVVDSVTGSSQTSTLDDPSFCTPDPAKISSFPTISFSPQSLSDERKFLIVEKEVVVTPTDHGEVIVLGSVAGVQFCPVDYGEHDGDIECGQRPIANVDLEPKIMENGSNVVRQGATSTSVVMSTTSGEDNISLDSIGGISFSDLQVHTFDDDVFNSITCDDKTEVSDFLARNDWKPQDDTDNSICSEPFGCCTINVDVKRSIIGASEKVNNLNNVTPPSTPGSSFDTSEVRNEEDPSISVHSEPVVACTVDMDTKDSVTKASESTAPLNELSPPNTPKKTIVFDETSPRFIYPEINMLDMMSDGSECGSSSSSQVDSFHLSDRFRDLNEYMESSSTDEDDESLDSSIDGSRTINALHNTHASGNESEVVTCADIVTQSDDESVDQESLVSSIFNDSRAMGAVSDDGVANFEVLKNFWTLEWLGVTKEQNEETNHSFDTSSMADFDTNMPCDGNRNIKNEEKDFNNRSLLSRNILETVEEEIHDESENDANASDLVISEATSAENSNISNEAEESVKNDNDVVSGDEWEYGSSAKNDLIFRHPRHSKKSYLRVRKWAVVKARSKSSKSKYCFDHIRRKINTKDYENEISNSRNFLTPTPEIDETVKAALDLISKRTHSEVNIENKRLLDYCNQSGLEQFQTQSSIHAIEHCGNNMIETEERKAETESVQEMFSTLVIPTGSERADCDRLGQLTNYLSPNAKEHRAGDIKDENNEKCTELETNLREVIADINQNETASSISETEADENLNEHIQEPDEQDLLMIEKTFNQALHTFDEVHVPELGTLTQKLYYTNTELAETLMKTQFELEMTKRRVEALLVDRVQLLIATTTLQKSKDVANNTRDELQELQIWLDEKNDLID